MNPSTKRNLWIAGVIVVLVALSVVLYIVGPKFREQQEAQQLEERVRQAEAPHQVATKTLTGTVKAVYGATIHLELAPGDLRFASALSETKYYSVNTGKLDAAGNPTVSTIALKDIAAGNTVTVISTDDIGTAKKFDVTEVRRIR